MKKIYGVIGDPVVHSLSPVMHNAGFQELGLNAEYKTFALKQDELKEFFKGMRQGDISGVNVTVPHKVAVMSFMDELTPEAQIVGAVNTITVSADGKLCGDNTDARGYLKSLLENFSFVSGKLNAVVIGAGGAALAVAKALTTLNPESIHVVNRTRERAEKITVRLQSYHPALFLQSADFSHLGILSDTADLIVNATSLGMKDNPWSDLAFLEKISDQCVVSDIVYKPLETEFLLKAKQHGAKILTGDGMLLYQAVLAFEKFTGKKAPVDVMRSALTQALV